MKKTSIPEQALLFYIRKFLDPEAKNNCIRIGRYVADIAFAYGGQKYNVEYDSFSQHKNSSEKDSMRNSIFMSHGYKVIRMRDEGLDAISNCVNISFIFPNYSKKSLRQASQGIMELLALFGIFEEIDVAADIETIKDMYIHAAV